MVNLDTFLFGELGSTMETFLEKLAQKCRLCKESPEAAAHILERMRDVFDVLRSQHRRANDLVVGRFVEVLVSFDWFFRVSVSEQSLLQHAMSQRVSLRSHVFHRRLDEVLELLSPLTVDSIHKWRDDSRHEDGSDETDAHDAVRRNGSPVGAAGAGDAHESEDSEGVHATSVVPTAAATLRSTDGPVKIVRFETNELTERFPMLGNALGDTNATRQCTGGGDDDDAAPAASTPHVDSEGSQPWRIHLYDLKYNPSADLIGKGAFGDVFKATWRDTPVVVKFMGYEDDGGAYSRDLFLHELRVWFPLRHPHVLKLYGACDVDKRYFVRKLAGNGNLLQYVKKSEANAARRWQLLHQVALGLQYLHEQGVVHNDLKCDNVLIGANGDAKIIDFGLSSIVNRAEVTVDPMRQGAVQWRSPEYIRGERLTPASDVYSFGMLIVEMVTGESPWGHSTLDVAVRYRLRKGMLRSQPASMSGVQRNLVRMMCAPDPSHRVTMSYVVEKLHQFIQSA